jgi:hypothetical protein
LFTWPTTEGEWRPFLLTDEQVEFYEANGYVAGIRLLNDYQLEALRAELAEFTDPSHPANPLFYEYHSNESTDPNKTLFHALGAWRVASVFHDLLWNPKFLMPASQLFWEAQCAFGMIRYFTSPRGTEAWLRAIRITLTGRGLDQWPTSPVGSALTIPRETMAAFIMFREAIAGICFPSPGWQMT